MNVKKGKRLTPLSLDYIDGVNWKLTKEFQWRFRDGTVIYVPPFTFDFNSVPRIFRWILLPTKYGGAATCHDWCYRVLGVVEVSDGINNRKKEYWSRKECDLRYREILEDTGCPYIKRTVLYWSVRVLGFFAGFKRKW